LALHPIAGSQERRRVSARVSRRIRIPILLTTKPEECIPYMPPKSECLGPIPQISKYPEHHKSTSTTPLAAAAPLLWSKYQITPNTIARLPPRRTTRRPTTAKYSCHGSMPVSSSRRVSGWLATTASASAFARPSPSPSLAAARSRFSDSSVRSRATIRLRGSEGFRETPPAPAPLASETKDG